EAIERPFQRGEKHPVAVDDGRGDDLAGDLVFPQVLAGLQLETGEVVLAVALAVGVGHVDLAAGDGGPAPEGGAEPLLPDRLALDGEDLQLAALGVEGDVAVGHGGGGGPVVLGPIEPDLLAGGGVEGVELVAAEAAAEEDLAVHYGRGRQRPVAGDDD